MQICSFFTVRASNFRNNPIEFDYKCAQYAWVDNIKMDLREVGWDGRDWIDLAQDRDRWRAHVEAVMNLRVP
jgi:hypothetical protein